jgi:cytochrome c biogenesis protein CcmG/thiol:disulfide interchange protein DsbE
MKMKGKLRFISAVAIFILIFNSYIFGEGTSILAPDFKLQDIYQNTYKLSNYRNKQPVLLFFWATWCPFCQKELRVLNQNYAELAEDGLEILAINVGELPDTVSSFVQSYHLAYRVLLDKDESVALSYLVMGIPSYVLIDEKGYIVFEDNYLPYKEYKDLVSKSASQSKE